MNIHSMQEMNYDDIKSYFNLMRKQETEAYFYCCNRVSKTLPDNRLIKFSEYSWHEKDIIIFDELCSWHQKYPINRPPFFRRFDGQHQHRLIKIYLDN